LSEAGDYNPKYQYAKDLIAENNKVKTLLPNPPPQTVKTAYPTAPITDYIPYEAIINQIVTYNCVLHFILTKVYLII
jgi:hypothetical protein